MTTPNKCRHCDSAVAITGDTGQYWVQCDQCEMSSPIMPSKIKARMMWDNMQRGLAHELEKKTRRSIRRMKQKGMAK